MRPRLQLAPEPPESLRREAALRIVVADDHDSMRRNLRLLLESDLGCEVVAEATNERTAVRHVHEHHPDVLVLDLHLRDGSALATVRELRRLAPDTRIVVMTMERSPEFARRALQAGASGYVLKEHSDTDLLPAVRAAARGERYLTPQIATGLDRQLGLDTRAELVD